MPRLILLNGPPGCGKSTLARRYVDEHPLALILDIDRVRDLIGQWRDNPHDAGLLARQITIAAARVHLGSGHDVVIPQFLGQVAFIETLERLAMDAGADFREIVLLDSKPKALRRFADRTRLGGEPAHRDAQEMLDLSGGLSELEAMYDRLLSVLGARPAAAIVRTRHGEADAAYQDFLREIDG